MFVLNDVYCRYLPQYRSLQHSHLGWQKSGQNVFLQSLGYIPQQPFSSQQSRVVRSTVCSMGAQLQSIPLGQPLTGVMPQLQVEVLFLAHLQQAIK